MEKLAAFANEPAIMTARNARTKIYFHARVEDNVAGHSIVKSQRFADPPFVLRFPPFAEFLPPSNCTRGYNGHMELKGKKGWQSSIDTLYQEMEVWYPFYRLQEAAWRFLTSAPRQGKRTPASSATRPRADSPTIRQRPAITTASSFRAVTRPIISGVTRTPTNLFAI